MLWGFLLQLMRGNSRQLLFLKEELIDKKVCSSPGATPQAEPLGVSNSERTSKKEHVVLHDRQQAQKELSWSAGVVRTVYK